MTLTVSMNANLRHLSSWLKQPGGGEGKEGGKGL